MPIEEKYSGLFHLRTAVQSHSYSRESIYPPHHEGRGYGVTSLPCPHWVKGERESDTLGTFSSHSSAQCIFLDAPSCNGERDRYGLGHTAAAVGPPRHNLSPKSRQDLRSLQAYCLQVVWIQTQEVQNGWSNLRCLHGCGDAPFLQHGTRDEKGDVCVVVGETAMLCNRGGRYLRIDHTMLRQNDDIGCACVC